MLEINKHARWIKLWVSIIDHKYGIGISSIFNTVFRYLPIFLTILWYWVPPNVPFQRSYSSMERWNFWRMFKWTQNFSDGVEQKYKISVDYLRDTFSDKILHELISILFVLRAIGNSWPVNGLHQDIMSISLPLSLRCESNSRPWGELPRSSPLSKMAVKSSFPPGGHSGCQISYPLVLH